MSEEGLGPKLVRPIVRFVGAAGVGGILLQDAMIRWWWIKLVLLGFIWIAGTDWALDKGPIGIWRGKHARLALGLIGLTTLPILWGGYLLYRGDAYNEPAAYIHIHPPAAIPAYTYFGPGKSLGFSVKGWKE